MEDVPLRQYTADDIEEERKLIIVMCGDVIGSSRWMRSTVEYPNVFKKFEAHLLNAFDEYKDKTQPELQKKIGDGIMAFHEVPEGKEQEVADRVFVNAFHLKKVVRHAIIGSTFPRPEGFRIRIVAGPSWKERIRGNGGLDYASRYVTMAHRLLSYEKHAACICHQSAKELLAPNFAESMHWDFKQVPRENRVLDGVDPEALDEIWSFDVKEPEK